MSSCLAIDIGNTSTTLGVVDGMHVRAREHIAGGIDAIDAVLSVCEKYQETFSFDGGMISSVVPNVNCRWDKFIRGHIGVAPLFLSHTSALRVGIDYPEPNTIGADRLANSCAAVACYGFPVIVADFGTALTFDVISDDQVYIGGVIAPGMPLMTDYLAERTALLPLISPRGACEAVGKSTVGAMRIGARVGYRGMVREITSYLRQQSGMKNAVCVATGGYAQWVLAEANMNYQIDEDLTLKGIGIAYELNKQSN